MTTQSIEWLIGLVISSGISYAFGVRQGKIAQQNLDLQTQNTRPVIATSVTLEQRTDSAAFDVVVSLGCGGAAIRDVDGKISFEPDDKNYARSMDLSLPAMLPGANHDFRVAERLHAQCFDRIRQNAFPMKVRVEFRYVDPQNKVQDYCTTHRYLGYSPFVAERCGIGIE
jgi:hypothetical protein